MVYSAGELCMFVNVPKRPAEFSMTTIERRGCLVRLWVVGVAVDLLPECLRKNKFLYKFRCLIRELAGEFLSGPCQIDGAFIYGLCCKRTLKSTGSRPPTQTFVWTATKRICIQRSGAKWEHCLQSMLFILLPAVQFLNSSRLTPLQSVNADELKWAPNGWLAS